MAASTETREVTARSSGIIHEAFLYAGVDEFVSGMVPFVEEGRRDGGPVLVAVTAANADALKSALPGPQDGVRFVHVESEGRNPGRIISLWRNFLSASNGGGVGVRGIGEPIWAGRSPSELVECHQHELLLNLAFGAGPSWRLACPYDVSTLPDQVLEQARRNHPTVSGASGRSASPSYLPDYAHVLAEPLPPPPAELAGQLRFELDGLPGVRRLASRLAAQAQAAPRRQADFITAVNEVATNSIRYGGGTGQLRLWLEPSSLVAEISDRGVIDSPLIGRQRPAPGPSGGYGLWLVHQLCDLVQLRSDPITGTVVRMHLRTGTG
ncbi:MAG: anti-sigma factor RsbA family regulatory protein [Actinomycetes bacterium]|nr:anti-sigma factor RsbA family regulatory protein [Actinomycetes bacterium]